MKATEPQEVPAVSKQSFLPRCLFLPKPPVECGDLVSWNQLLTDPGNF